MEDQQGHVSLKTRSSSALWTFAIAILCHSLRTLPVHNLPLPLSLPLSLASLVGPVGSVGVLSSQGPCLPLDPPLDLALELLLESTKWFSCHRPTRRKSGSAALVELHLPYHQ